MREVVSLVVVGVCMLAVATVANAADPEPAPASASAVREPALAPPGPKWRGAVLPDQWKKSLLRTGTRLSIAFDNDRLDNNASYISLRPQYEPQLNLSVTQPLLRDFGWDF